MDLNCLHNITLGSYLLRVSFNMVIFREGIGTPPMERLLDSLEVDHALKLAISLLRAYLIAMKL